MDLWRDSPEANVIHIAGCATSSTAQIAGLSYVESNQHRAKLLQIGESIAAVVPPDGLDAAAARLAASFGQPASSDLAQIPTQRTMAICT